MNDALHAFLVWGLDELTLLLEPLADAADDPRRLYTVFSRFGWNLEGLLGGVDAAPLLGALGDVREALSRARAAADTPAAPAEIVASVVEALRQAHELLGAVCDRVVAGEPAPLDAATAAALARDLAEHLVIAWLGRRAPRVLMIAGLLGLLVTEPATPLESGGRLLRFPVRRPVLSSARLLTLRDSPLAALLAQAGSAGSAGSAGGLAGMQRRFERLARLLEDGGLSGLTLTVDLDGISVSGWSSPLLAPDAEPVRVPLPVGGALAPELVLGPGRLGLSWAAGAEPGAEVVLVDQGGFRVVAAGEAECPDRGLTLSMEAGGLRLSAVGGLAVELPLAALHLDGASVKASGCAELSVSTDAGVSLLIRSVKGSFEALRLGGPGGPRIDGAGSAGIELRGLRFPPPGDPLEGVEVLLSGALSIAGLGASASVDVALSEGSFKLRGAGTLDLGGGLRLAPVDERTPVIEASVGLSAAPSLALAVAGKVELPHREGTRAVALTASLELATLADGGLQVRRLFGGAGALGAWELAEGLVLKDDPGVSLSYASDRFELRMKGGVELTSGGDFQAGGALDAALAFDPDDPLRITVDAALTDVRLALGAEARVLDAEMRLQLRTRPAAGEAPVLLSLTGGSAGLFLDGSDPTRIESYLLAIEQARGAFSPRLDGFDLTLGGTLLLPAALAPGGARPAVSIGSGGEEGLRLGLSIEGGAPRLSFSGTIALTADLPIPFGPEGSGFELVFLGDADGGATSLTLEGDEARLSLTIDAGLRLTLPADVLSDVDGDRVGIGGEGSLSVAIHPGSDPGFDLALEVRELSLSVDQLHLGGEEGLLIEEGSVRLINVTNAFARDLPEAERLQLTLDGKLTCPLGAGSDEEPDAISLDLQNARFIFNGAELPGFNVDGLGVSAEGGLFSSLPLRVQSAKIRFKVEHLPEKLYPENIEIYDVSAALEVPLASVGGALGQVSGVAISIEDGLPRVRIDGLTLGITRLDLPGMSVGGAVAVRGLTTFPELLFAGTLRGMASGMGAGIVVALRLVGRPPVLQFLGGCLEVSGGSAGIPLGVTGFLLTGVSGGVSLANNNGSPCDVLSYLGLGSGGGGQRGGGKGVPSRRPSSGPCECPPRAMNILCQPHPTEERAILKFSSLDRELLERCGITEEFVASVAGGRTPAEYAGDLTAAVVRMLEDEVRELLPEPASGPLYPPPEGPLAEIVQDPLRFWRTAMTDLLRAGLGQVVDETPYEALVRLARVGIPCPDMTLQVTATFSYTGLSAFLSVTGGVNVSTAGSVGVIGSVNVLGIPVGTARIFLTLTGPTGDIDPGFCGDVRCVVGPLDLGYVGCSYRLSGSGFLGALLDVVRAGASALPPAVLARALGDAGASGLDALTREQAIALAAVLRRLPIADARDGLIAMLRAGLRAYQPLLELRGAIEPRLFGLSLATLGAASASFTKDAFEASVSFSPLYLLGRLNPIADLFSGADAATLSMRLEWRDPGDWLLAALSDDLATPAALAAYAEDAIEDLLRAATVTLTYVLSPLGLELVNAAGRAVMPYLTPHPEAQASGWENPDGDSALPTRSEALAAALDAHLLGSPAWKGDLGDLGPRFHGKLLQRDYFPHGGILGAGSLRLPEALVDAPDLQALSTVLDEGADPPERLEAAITIVKAFLNLVECGSLGFYVPAPTPPLVFMVEGAQATARALIESLTTLELPAEGRLDDFLIDGRRLFRTGLAFLRGEIRGKLLGVPVANATIELPAVEPGEQGHFLVEAGVPEGSWLHPFLGSARLQFRLRKASDEDVLERWGEVAGALVAAAEREGDDDAARRVLADFTEAIRTSLPKVALEMELADVQVPAPFSEVLELQGGARLVAYSPGYDPSAPATDAASVARRRGGIVLEGRFKLAFGEHLRVSLPRAQIAFAPTGDATLPELSISVVLDEALVLGALRLEALPGGRLELDAQLRATEAGLHARLELSPARLRSSALGDATIARVHGETPGSPFTIDTLEEWDAHVSLEGGLELMSPFDPADPPLLRGSASMRGTLSGTGLDEVTLVLGPATMDVEVFPDSPWPIEMSQQWIGLELGSDRSTGFEMMLDPIEIGDIFKLHDPRNEHDRLRVHLSPYGLSVDPGARLALKRLSDTTLRLNPFVINGDCRIRVSATGRTLDIGSLIHLRAGTIRFTTDLDDEDQDGGGGGVALILRAPEVTVFPASPLEGSFPLGPPLSIDSSGRFSALYAFDGVVLLGRFVKASGEFEIGNAPGTGPTIKLSGALEVPPLPPFRESFELSSDLVPLGSIDRYGVQGLLDVGPCDFSLRMAGGSLTLEASATAVRVLSKEVSAANVTLSVGRDDVALSCEVTGAIALVPGQLELDLERARLTGEVLSLGARVRALKVGGGWLVNVSSTLEIGLGDFSSKIPDAPAIEPASVRNVVSLSVPSGGLYLTRTGGEYGIEANVSVWLLGQRFTIRGAVGSDGRVVLGWEDRRFYQDGFSIAPSEGCSISFDLLHAGSPDIRVDLSGGWLNPPSSWGIRSIPFPRLETAAASFELKAGSYRTRTGWRELITGVEVRVSNPYIEATLKDGVVTVTLTISKVSVRTTATLPSGKPVAQASLGGATCAVDSTGKVVRLELPQLDGFAAFAPISPRLSELIR